MMNRIHDWLNRVPGYTGYHDKERRRDEDKLVRDTVAMHIDRIAASIQGVGRTLANARQLQEIEPVESLYQRITLLGDKIRNATWGYAGLFDEMNVDAAALDQIGRFDRQMTRELDALDAAASAVQAAGTDPGALQHAVSDANAEITRLETLWESRSTVVAKGRPTSDQRVLALLDEPAHPAAPAATTPTAVKPGAALSILGDNFVADLTMDIASDGEQLNLARVSEGDWLLQTSGSSDLTARLREGATPDTAPPGRQGRLTITRKDGTAQQAAVAWAVNVAGDAVTMQIDFGDERRAYSGNKIAPGDVEIYGQPA